MKAILWFEKNFEVRVITGSSPENELRALEPGAVFHDRYEVVRCLKAGGMGAVYEVIHLETRRRRALKTMLPGLVTDPDLRARFKLEATVAAEIESEHIVEVLDAGVDGATGLPFLVMELLRGESLAARLSREGPLPFEEVVLLLRQASLALGKTHAAGIVHRDLKPENLFLTLRDDGTPHLKLLDFGIAKVIADGTQPNTTRSFGTPFYMSPEQIRGDGDIGPAADLYSLAQIAFTLLVGRPYWESQARGQSGVYALLIKITAGPIEPASRRALELSHPLPAAVDAWFERAVAKDSAERFDSASELVESLAEALGIREAAGSTDEALTNAISIAPSSGPRRIALWITLVLAATTGAALWLRARADRGIETARPARSTEHVSRQIPAYGAVLAPSAPVPAANAERADQHRPPAELGTARQTALPVQSNLRALARPASRTEAPAVPSGKVWPPARDPTDTR